MKFVLPDIDPDSLSYETRKAMQDHLDKVQEQIIAAREDGIKQGLAADDSKAKQLALMMAQDNERLRSRLIHLQHGSKAEPEAEMLTAWRNTLRHLFTDAQATDEAIDSLLLDAYRYGYGCRKQEREELARVRDELAQLQGNVIEANVEAEVEAQEEE